MGAIKDSDAGKDSEKVRENEDDKKIMSFAELGVCEQLTDACTALGWKAPTPIQTNAIPLALAGRDMIGLAQTGSGKTAAFAIPILQALLEKSQSLFACVISPTRELAIQIGEQFEALGSGIGVKCAVVVGGVDMMAQAIALAKRPHIVVGTPGRLVDHLSNTKGFSLRALKYLVLDEADRLLNLDFETEINEILKVIPKERRTYLFSATMTTKVQKLQRACLRNPAKVEVSSKYSTVDTLKQEYIFCPAKFKDCYLVHMLTEMAGNTIMVFTRTCEATRKVALTLRNLGLDAITISGQMSQPKRLGALNKFKAGERNILICTDVASRGLDIPSVDVVINYDIPSNSKDYIHRVGRTARAGRAGRAVSMVTQYDVELYQRIEQLIDKKLPTYLTVQEDVLQLAERVSEAQRLAALHMREHDGGSKHKKRKGGDDGELENPGRSFCLSQPSSLVQSLSPLAVSLPRSLHRPLFRVVPAVLIELSWHRRRKRRPPSLQSLPRALAAGSKRRRNGAKVSKRRRSTTWCSSIRLPTTSCSSKCPSIS